MSLSSATPNQLVGVLNSMLGKHRSILVGEVKLASWLPDLEACRAALLRFVPNPDASGEGVPAPAPAGPLPPRTADLRNEAAARCYRHLVRAQIEAALARGDEEGARRWSGVEEATLREGLSFLREPLRAQVGGAQRCLTATQHASIAPTLAAPPLAVDFKEALGLLQRTTDDLQAALDADAPEQAPTTPTPTLASAQRDARSTIDTVLRVARKALSAADVAKLEEALPK